MQKNSNEISRAEFMQKVGISFSGILLMNCISACSSDEIPDPNPGSGDKINFVVDLNAAENSDLKILGGYVIKTSNTGRKIIIARTKDAEETYLAVDGICPHQDGLMSYIGASNIFKCTKPGIEHGSEFKADGTLVAGTGSATTNLVRYRVVPNISANTLSILSA